MNETAANGTCGELVLATAVSKVKNGLSTSHYPSKCRS